MRRRFISNKSESNNIIRYTSTDGNVVIPFVIDFGVLLISNTYTNKGLMVFKSDVTSIGNMVFSNCTSLVNIQIPNSVTSIGDVAFYTCTNLTSIKIPNSVISIGNEAFGGCKSLTSIEIPNSVTIIEDLVFFACTNLTSIKIPDNVTSIGYGAFQSCTSLTSIEIPNSVTSIRTSAFYDCSKLTSVYVKPTTPPKCDSNVFYNNDSDRKIYVPRASLNAYKTASGWSDYASAIEPYDFNGGGQFYVRCEGGVDSDTYTFTIDSQKTWGECVGLKDDTGVAEISSYEEVVPGSGMYRFYIHIHDDLYDYWYAVESDGDYNIPTPEDKIKINTTYEAFEV